MKIRPFFPLVLLLVVALLTGTGCSKSARAKRFVAKGDREFKAGELQKAEIYYLNALKLTGGKTPGAIRQLGLIYYEQGKLLRGFSLLQQAAEDEPENLDVRLKLGMANLAMRRLKEAREAASLVLAKDPGNEEALLLLAETAMAPKEIEETRQRVENLRKQDKDRAGYHLALATLYARQKELVKAEAECQQALKLDPKSSAAYIALGNFALLKNDLAAAERAFKTGSELAPPRSARRLKYAEFKLQTGDTEVARKLFEEIARQTPDYLPVLSSLMQTALAERKLDDCAALTKRVLALEPMDFGALLMSGRLELVKKNADAALTDFQRMLPMYKDYPQVHHNLALAYLLKDDISKAIGSLNQALQLDPQYPDSILALAELKIRQGNPAAAVTPLTTLIKERPQLPQAYLLLASAYGAQKDLAAAAEVLRGMTRAFPKSPEASALLGGILGQQGKLAEARAALEHALELSPDYFPATEQLVYLDLAEKKPQAALDRVHKLIQAKPAAAEPLVLLATVQLAQREKEQAEATLLKAVDQNPDNRTAYMMLAGIYLDSGRQQQALERLYALVAKKTNDLPALTMIGVLNESLNKPEPARDAYEKVLAVNSNAVAVLNNLAYLYSERFGKADRALELAERARKLAPEDPSIADTLGWLCYKKGDYLRALGLVQQGAAKLGDNPEVQFHLGMTHYMLAQEEPARLALQKAVQNTNDFPWKAEGQRRLAVLAMNTQSAGPDAVKDLEARQQKDPDDPIVLARLAAVYEARGDTNQAVKAYETVLKNNPKNVTAMLKLVAYYSSPALNDSARVLDLLKEAHRLSPDDAGISYQLARRVYQSGDHKWALSLFQESAGKFAQDPNVTFDLALAQYSAGQVSEAEDSAQAALKMPGAFARAEEAKRFLALVNALKSAAQTQAMAAQAAQILKTDSNYVPALMIAGALHKAQGHAAEAINAYQYILARFPLFTPAMRELALLYADQPESDQKAFELATKAREAFPGDPQVARALGILAFRKGDYRRSLQLLAECAPSYASDPNFNYYKGMAHYQLKQSAESKAALQKALALNLDPKLGAEAKRTLAELK